MAYTLPTYAVNNIQTLDDLTIDQATVVKVLHDKTGADIKAFQTDVMIPEMEVTDAANVKKTGDQAITGVKTFSTSPIVPTPTTATQASNKSYVDSQSPLTIGNGSVTDLKLSDAVGDIKERFTTYKAETTLNLGDYPRIIPELDDSARVIRAIADLTLTRGKGKIIFPNVVGGYFINQRIPVKRGDITFDGQGNLFTASSGLTWAFSAYPPTLEGIVDGTTRPVGFENGIDGDFRTIMYESDPTQRLSNIHFKNFNWVESPVQTSGRMVNFFSCDNVSVKDCTFNTYSAPVEFFYCSGYLFKDNTVTAQAFCLFNFKSKRYKIVNNNFNGGIIGVENKGAYPQSGKTIYQAFDVGYLYNQQSVISGNSFSNCVSNAIQLGYYDNSSADISSGVAVGVIKRDWYGEVWGVDVHDNTFKCDTPTASASDTRAVRFNMNARHNKFHDNVVYDYCVELMGCTHNEVKGNKFINGRIPSTPIVLLRGVTLGGESQNSEYNKVENNDFYSGTSAPIQITGGNYNGIKGNKFYNTATGICVNVLNSAIVTPSTKSNYNTIEDNDIFNIPTDWANPIVVDQLKGDYNLVRNNRGYGGFWSGNALKYDSGVDGYKKGIVKVATADANIGVAGTNTAYDNFGDYTVLNNQAGYAQEFGVEGCVSSDWRYCLKVGKYFLWVDSTGRLRIKATKPTSDTDGTIVGTQL